MFSLWKKIGKVEDAKSEHVERMWKTAMVTHEPVIEQVECGETFAVDPDGFVWQLIAGEVR